MKKYLLVLLVVLTTQAFSQNKDEQYMPPAMQQQNNNGTTVNLNMYKTDRYKKMMVKGIVLASLGAVCAGGGTALLVDGLNVYGNFSPGSTIIAPGGPQIAGGTALIIVGAVGVCLGTSLAIIGYVKSKKHQNQVSLLFTPTGCRIAYTF